ncbi:uncharacterized protein LOC115681827 [Syzygium oleosum]|uniref:uncharacterized protein LOC115681827 n=1 Tax=Syzygium oleosum TaxID=219896 RepID=UPI0011D22408|nr:uncharacterized protein LOC115681827 [Syzygium oleosum]
MHQLVEHFLKLKPPKFDGKGDLEAASLWVEELEKAFALLRCTEEEKVTLVVYQLQGNANDWWKATRGRVFPTDTTQNWTAFTEAFNGKYFSESAQVQKMAEFLRLRQGKMTVDQYEAEFARLSKFALKMVDDPLDKARRFLDGLKLELRSQLIMLNLRDYNELYEWAQAVERDMMERAAAFRSRYAPARENRILERNLWREIGALSLLSERISGSRLTTQMLYVRVVGVDTEMDLSRVGVERALDAVNEGTK